MNGRRTGNFFLSAEPVANSARDRLRKCAFEVPVMPQLVPLPYACNERLYAWVLRPALADVVANSSKTIQPWDMWDRPPILAIKHFFSGVVARPILWRAMSACNSCFAFPLPIVNSTRNCLSIEPAFRFKSASLSIKQNSQRPQYDSGPFISLTASQRRAAPIGRRPPSAGRGRLNVRPRFLAAIRAR